MRALMEGSEAIAEAAIAAGCRFFAGYPMTPFTELLEGFAKRLPEEGGACINAESEIEAMVDRALLEAERRADPSLDLLALAKSASRIATRPVLEAILNETDWNRTRSAQRLGISSKSLAVKIRECGLQRPS